MGHSSSRHYDHTVHTFHGPPHVSGKHEDEKTKRNRLDRKSCSVATLNSAPSTRPRPRSQEITLTRERDTRDNSTRETRDSTRERERDTKDHNTRESDTRDNNTRDNNTRERNTRDDNTRERNTRDDNTREGLTRSRSLQNMESPTLVAAAPTASSHRHKKDNTREGLTRSRSLQNYEAYPSHAPTTTTTTSTTTTSTLHKNKKGNKKIKPHKVMKTDELTDMLESMGFTRAVIAECIGKLRLNADRTVIDADTLIEQMLALSRANRGYIQHRQQQQHHHHHQQQQQQQQQNEKGGDIDVTSISQNTTTSSSSSAAATTEKRISEESAGPNLGPTVVTESDKTVSGDYVEDDTQLSYCKICFERPIETVILRCGHLALCVRCSVGLKNCPICRKTVTEVVRIFHA